jgi:hypothetical protein
MDAFSLLDAIASLIIILLVLHYVIRFFRSMNIRISLKTKKYLDNIRENGETYEDAIRRVIGGRK